MRKLFLVLVFAASLIGCEKDENPSTIDATIIGRWHAVGFEEVVLYEFTADKRYTIYSSDGTFPTLEEFMAENPELRGHDWSYDGEVVVVDLNFGNFSRRIPTFRCDNYAIDWIGEDGTTGDTYFREGYDMSECN